MAAPDRFAELMAREEAQIDLARACLLLAQDAYPGRRSSSIISAFLR